MFAITAFFELFDVLLTYFSNTISFVRMGAFAVSHAAMMEVVLMLAGAALADPQLDRHCTRKRIRLRHGRPDRCYSGSSSGILRDVQPLLQRRRPGIQAFPEKTDF